jgi:hypothetical protein
MTWLIVAGLVVLLAVGAFALWQTRQAGPPAPQTADDIVLRDDWVRLTIRAERDTNPEKDWVNVRVQAFGADERQAQYAVAFERWPRATMQAFEDRLTAGGWSKNAEGTSDRLSPAFQRMDRFVVYGRES